MGHGGEGGVWRGSALCCGGFEGKADADVIVGFRQVELETFSKTGLQKGCCGEGCSRSSAKLLWVIAWEAGVGGFGPGPVSEAERRPGPV